MTDERAYDSPVRSIVDDTRPSVPGSVTGNYLRLVDKSISNGRTVYPDRKRPVQDCKGGAAPRRANGVAKLVSERSHRDRTHMKQPNMLVRVLATQGMKKNARISRQRVL